MAIWLFRAGSSGEYENKFLEDNRVYLTWEELKLDLTKFKSKKDLYNYLLEDYGAEIPGRARNWASQIWPIAHEIKIGDWIVLPSKMKASVHIGEITGEYVFDKKQEDPYFHYRAVRWFATDIPRVNFDQDILYSFGAFMTVCRISRNDAENRIREMGKNKWMPKEGMEINRIQDVEDELSQDGIDFEQYAMDHIAKHLMRKFKGHGMARIVEAILKAKGYVTYRSPEGPDKGVDILASQGPLGFGSPKLCIQVKTTDAQVDRPILDQLVGTMHNYKADHGLLVSWSGFKSSVYKEIPSQFFNVRLWDQKEIINELLENYEKLDDEIKAEIPLKRIWTLTFPGRE
ncbi:restriction endonuclease [Ruminiclostridium papyrosolvens]|uniref:Restriction endonuclease n=1 Tax=Ruminiclostridium papyrosolvens C7 TaxID=1330534 RepID=U4R741_9FIRM|nr:restriction endonuclease [Ruminiclostridium papyrosolvens]EPR14070.1 restriction endonuclease [Ruminiclostridium papyrosolvens C7]